MLQCKELLCEYLDSPVGIDETRPRLSWRLESDRESVLQTAYEIRVSGMWESGRVESRSCVNIPYGGAPLQPFTRYFWSVRAWDNCGEVSDWAEGYFETGLLTSDNWDAQWITTAEGNETMVLPVFRKDFSLEEIPAEARIYATALGLYEITLNGERVGDSWLTPGMTSYNKHLLYQTYDVTKLLKEKNTLRVTLGNGWCRGRFSWTHAHHVFPCEPGILLQLRAALPGGTVYTLGTDESWEYSESAYRFSDIYDGEIYDAALAGEECRRWKPVRPYDYPTAHICAQEHEPVRITERLKPVRVFVTPKGETVVDFGQNFAGWAEFRVSGKKGDRVRLSFGEVLDGDGNFYNANNRSARNRVEYILSGEGEERWHPHFSYQGFRYVRVDEFPGDVTTYHFTGVVIHSDMKRIGRFRCGNDEVNRLYCNTVWGQRTNYMDFPADSHQRDERLGWTGDAQLFTKTAALHYRVDAFFKKWLTDMRLDQCENGEITKVVPDTLTFPWETKSSPGWGDAVTICPWEMYRAYGDRRVLEKQYESMRAWVEYIRTQDGGTYLWVPDFAVGDWLAPDSPVGFTEKKERKGKTAFDFIATVFYANSVKLTAETAELLGRTEDAAEYNDLYAKIRRSFLNEFATPNGRLVEDTQTAYAMALYFGLTENRQRAVERLAQLIEENGTRLSTGFMGTPYLCHALSDNGRADLAYSLILQTECPSWLYEVRHGATTVWERWNGIQPDGSLYNAADDPLVTMNSFNHCACAAVADWLYTKAAGIQYDDSAPGYQRIVFRPMPDKRFGFAEAELDTMYGTVRSAWRCEGETVSFTVTVPPNTTAVFEAPNGGRTELGSGTHHFTAEYTAI